MAIDRAAIEKAVGSSLNSHISILQCFNIKMLKAAKLAG